VGVVASFPPIGGSDTERLCSTWARGAVSDCEQPSWYAFTVLAANGPFLTIHPGAILRLPQKHPSLTAIAVDMRVTRKPICLFTLRNRSLSPVAKLFTEVAFAVAKTMKR
jgi:hypothetical protein